jgi:hypothetical protein
MKLFFQFSFLCFVAFFAMQCSPKLNKTVQKEKSVSTAPPAVPPTPSMSTGATLSDVHSNIPTEAVEMESTPISNEQLAIQKGNTIWSSSCIKCHELYPPEERTARQWDKIMSVMAVKAELTDDEKEKVVAYLHANAKQ